MSCLSCAGWLAGWPRRVVFLVSFLYFASSSASPLSSRPLPETLAFLESSSDWDRCPARVRLERARWVIGGSIPCRGLQPLLGLVLLEDGGISPATYYAHARTTRVGRSRHRLGSTAVTSSHCGHRRQIRLRFATHHGFDLLHQAFGPLDATAWTREACSSVERLVVWSWRNDLVRIWALRSSSE